MTPNSRRRSTYQGLEGCPFGLFFPPFLTAMLGPNKCQSNQLVSWLLPAPLQEVKKQFGRVCGSFKFVQSAHKEHRRPSTFVSSRHNLTLEHMPPAGTWRRNFCDEDAQDEDSQQWRRRPKLAFESHTQTHVHGQKMPDFTTKSR